MKEVVVPAPAQKFLHGTAALIFTGSNEASQYTIISHFVCTRSGHLAIVYHHTQFGCKDISSTENNEQ